MCKIKSLCSYGLGMWDMNLLWIYFHFTNFTGRQNHISLIVEAFGDSFESPLARFFLHLFFIFFLFPFFSQVSQFFPFSTSSASILSLPPLLYASMLCARWRNNLSFSSCISHTSGTGYNHTTSPVDIVPFFSSRF